MTLLIDCPALVLVPVAVLAALGVWSRSRVTLTAAGLWLAYLVWELAVREDRPDANIRIDLLVLYPVLLVMTVVGLWTGRSTSPRDEGEEGPRPSETGRSTSPRDEGEEGPRRSR